MPYSVITSEDEAPGPPVIVQNPEEEVTEVGEGQTAKFMCRVGGSPAPAVFWYRNEQLIKQVRKNHRLFSSLLAPPRKITKQNCSTIVHTVFCRQEMYKSVHDDTF